VKNLSSENGFELHDNEPIGGTHFHLNGFARRLVLKQRQKAARKWPILRIYAEHCDNSNARFGTIIFFFLLITC